MESKTRQLPKSPASLHSFFFFKNFRRNKVGQLLITPFKALALYEWNLWGIQFFLWQRSQLRFVKYFLGLFHSLSSFAFSVSLLWKQCIMLPEASGFSAGFLDLRYATFELYSAKTRETTRQFENSQVLWATHHNLEMCLATSHAIKSRESPQI